MFMTEALVLSITREAASGLAVRELGKVVDARAGSSGLESRRTIRFVQSQKEPMQDR